MVNTVAMELSWNGKCVLNYGGMVSTHKPGCAQTHVLNVAWPRSDFARSECERC